MKIGYICADVEVPLFGHEGCSIHIRQFTQALVDEGHDVFILCSSLGERRDVSIGARVHHVTPRGLPAGAWQSLRSDPAIVNANLERDLESILFNGSLGSEGMSIVERERPALLYERYSLFGWGGAELARRSGIPLMMEINAPLCDQQKGYEKFVLTRAAGEIESLALRSADAVVALSSWLKDWAIARGVDHDRVHVIPDGVNHRLFGGPVSGDGVRDRYGLRGKRVIGHVGSFQWFHDIDGLLRVFCRLHETDPDLRLLLVGSGPERKRLEKEAWKRGVMPGIVVAGRVPHEHVPEFIAAMDVAVVPYRDTEDFFFSPMKLFECMAAGAPTVAAALGQIKDVVEHGRTGWLYTAGNEDELIEGIRALLDAPGMAREIGQAARAKVLAEYTWQAVVRRVIAVGEQLIETRTRAGGPGHRAEPAARR